MIYAGSIGTQIANELIDTYRCRKWSNKTENTVFPDWLYDVGGLKGVYICREELVKSYGMDMDQIQWYKQKRNRIQLSYRLYVRVCVCVHVYIHAHTDYI